MLSGKSAYHSPIEKVNGENCITQGHEQKEQTSSDAVDASISDRHWPDAAPLGLLRPLPEEPLP